MMKKLLLIAFLFLASGADAGVGHPNLKMWYRFQDVNDSSGNGYNLTASGAGATIGTGVIGNGAVFSGVASFGRTITAENIPNKFTITGRWKPIKSTGIEGMGYVASALNATACIYYAKTGDKLEINWTGRNSVPYEQCIFDFPGSCITASVFNHMVIVFDGTQSSPNQIKLYVNGVAITPTVTDADVPSGILAAATILVGSWSAATDSVDEFRFYSGYAFTPEDAKREYGSFEPLGRN